MNRDLDTGYRIREGSRILAERFALLGELEATPDRQPGGDARTPQGASLQLAEQAVPQVAAGALSLGSSPPRGLLGLTA